VKIDNKISFILYVRISLLTHIILYQDIDAIIFATGYEYKIGIIDDSITRIEKNKTTLYKYMFPPNLAHPTLAVVGLVQPIGAVMPISEMQCRWYTQVMTGKLL